MAKKPVRKNETDEMFSDEENKPAVVKTFEIGVISALNKRGLSKRTFDHVIAHYLWEDNYRVNCHLDNKIVESYFVSYHEHEGIFRCIPEVV